MWIKASGMALDTITPEGFVGMDLNALHKMVRKQYPVDPPLREHLAKELLLGCRMAGEERKRPSVETGMHALLPHRIVFHTHPTLVNGITCAREGKDWVERLFGDEILWVPVVNPGIVLSQYLDDRLQEYARKHSNPYPVAIFLQNHGLLVYGDSLGEIQSRHRRIETRILEDLPEDLQALYREWEQTTVPSADSETSGFSYSFTPLAQGVQDKLEQVVSMVKEFFLGKDGISPSESACILTDTSPFFQPYYSSREMFSSIDGPFTPDHVVYAGHRLLWVEEGNLLKEALRTYRMEEEGAENSFESGRTSRCGGTSIR
jgi:rhamnose utilization protein RhaD (predicted bifunctional aldolase and dehydrogenase)